MWIPSMHFHPKGCWRFFKRIQNLKPLILRLVTFRQMAMLRVSKVCFLQKILSRIHCVHVYDVFQMLNIVENIRKDFVDQSPAILETRLLIIDSVASVISPILCGGGLYLGLYFSFLCFPLAPSFLDLLDLT